MRKFFTTILIFAFIVCVSYPYPVLAANSHSIDLELDSSQYLSAVDSASLSQTGDMTIEFFAKLESAPADGTSFHVISKFLPTGNQESFLVQYENVTGGGDVYTPSFVVSDDGSTFEKLDVTQTIPVATWTHVAVTWDASASTAEFFIDSSSVGSNSGSRTSAFDSTATFNIGSMGGGANYADGLFDEVRLWSDIRTSTEISDNYLTELVGDEAGLVAYYKLNNSLLDETANNNDLTNNNSAVFSTDIPFGAPEVVTGEEYLIIFE